MKSVLRLPFDVAREIYCGVGMVVETCFPREKTPAERFCAHRATELPLTGDELVAVRKLIEERFPPESPSAAVSAPGTDENPAGDGRGGPAPAGPPIITAIDLAQAALAIRKYSDRPDVPLFMVAGWESLAAKFESAADELRAHI